MSLRSAGMRDDADAALTPMTRERRRLPSPGAGAPTREPPLLAPPADILFAAAVATTAVTAAAPACPPAVAPAATAENGFRWRFSEASSARSALRVAMTVSGGTSRTRGNAWSPVVATAISDEAASTAPPSPPPPPPEGAATPTPPPTPKYSLTVVAALGEPSCPSPSAALRGRGFCVPMSWMDIPKSLTDFFFACSKKGIIFPEYGSLGCPKIHSKN